MPSTCRPLRLLPARTELHLRHLAPMVLPLPRPDPTVLRPVLRDRTAPPTKRQPTQPRVYQNVPIGHTPQQTSQLVSWTHATRQENRPSNHGSCYNTCSTNLAQQKIVSNRRDLENIPPPLQRTKTRNKTSNYHTILSTGLSEQVPASNSPPQVGCPRPTSRIYSACPVI